VLNRAGGRVGWQEACVPVMPRKLRLEYSGACFHVTNRGNYQRHLFDSTRAAEAFYRCLDEACMSFGWQVHAFVVMGNHFHLAVETPEPNLSEGMKWLQRTWTQRFNRLRGIVRRPFQGRYLAKHVEPGRVQVPHHIPLNPRQAKREAGEGDASTLNPKLQTQNRRASAAWLAQRLQMGASDSLSSLLHRFRASGGTTTPAFTSILSGFQT
jgi:REP element-mobilizing transposase RayT